MGAGTGKKDCLGSIKSSSTNLDALSWTLVKEELFVKSLPPEPLADLLVFSTPDALVKEIFWGLGSFWVWDIPIVHM